MCRVCKLPLAYLPATCRPCKCGLAEELTGSTVTDHAKFSSTYYITPPCRLAEAGRVGGVESTTLPPRIRTENHAHRGGVRPRRDGRVQRLARAAHRRLGPRRPKARRAARALESIIAAHALGGAPGTRQEIIRSIVDLQVYGTSMQNGPDT